MAAPHIRIFPHDTKEEFRSIDQLTSWLLTGLRARGGMYHLKSAGAVADLPRGSLVLFRYGNVIVGEAIVWKEKELENMKDRTVSGEMAEYEAKVTFAPSSIRLYSPPLPCDFVQTAMKALGDDKDFVKFAGAYTKLENWSIYGSILAEVVSRGTFIP